MFLRKSKESARKLHADVADLKNKNLILPGYTRN